MNDILFLYKSCAGTFSRLTDVKVVKSKTKEVEKMEETKWKVVGTSFPKTVSFDNEGDNLIGKLLEKRVIKTDKVKKGFINAYDIDTEKEIVSVLGTGHLDYLMKQVTVGDKVRITYHGQEKTKIDKETFNVHKYQVEVAQSNGKEQQEDLF